MKKGFTLIELLIVISIIGILAVALLPNIISAPATARDAGRKATLNSVLSALEQYKSANGAYPGTPGTGACLDTFTALAPLFKGGAVPTGANTTAANETNFGCVTATSGSPAKIAYCPLATNSQGYSYAVAIRMEQAQPGPNGVAASTTCGSLVSGGAYVAPTAAATNGWYYMVQ